MSTPTAPLAPARNAQGPARGRAPAIASLLTPLAYLLWFWVMFAFGYWITDLMGAYPATQTPLRDLGVAGWIAAIVFAVLVALPSWLGIALALRARRLGAGVLGSVALAVNVVLACAAMALGFFG